MPVFALADANNFYCSCERAFDPALIGLPIVVLSNNDGCVIARSQESKDLGIKMGAPWFQIAKWAEGQGVRKYSSNYNLYGDMSRRIFEVLSRTTPIVEPYSIDEMFLDLTATGGDLVDICRATRFTVRQETKIPMCVGIGETKTKAKLANWLAKKRPQYGGVADLRDAETCAAVYSTIAVHEVWGIGAATAQKLARLGIETVADFIRIDQRQARDLLTVVGSRVAMELQGVSCLPLSMIAPQKKGLAVTRSFSQAVTAWPEMREAVSSYATRAAEKLRGHGLVARGMTVFMHTNKHNGDDWYSNSTSFGIEPGADTFQLIGDALGGARSIWRPGFRYAKAGIMLNDLAAADDMPAQLFPTRNPVRTGRLMSALDEINGRYGRGTLVPAATGIAKPWSTKASWHSPRYTTRLDEIMRVRAI